MISPHGNTLVDRFVSDDRSVTLRAEFDERMTVTLDRTVFFDFLNIAHGAYSPLRGFMSRNDFLKVLNDITLENGVCWPLPVVIDVGAEVANAIAPGQRIGLRGPDGAPVGVMDVDSVYRYNETETCETLFGTTDEDHPGVRAIRSREPFLVGGPIKAFPEAGPREGPYDLTPTETRVLFRQRGWDTVVGFQTRNVPHRAHEYLQKSALEHVDGLLIQPKVGQKKPTDYTDEAILEGYEALVQNYYPEESVALSVFKSRMWYAGPREAVFDAIVRKNYGCTHFIVGRDHAGVGDYYSDFEARRLFEAVGENGLELLHYHYAFYCEVCDGIVSGKICPHDEEHHMEPSGTWLRELLSNGERPPPELMRPEVAERVTNMSRIFVGS